MLVELSFVPARAGDPFTGRGGVTVQVDDARAGILSGKFRNLGIRADLHDGAFSYGDRLGDRVLSIDGEHAAVKQEEVARFALRGEMWTRQPNKQCEN